MVHGSAGQQLFLVVCGLTIVTSPLIVLLLQRRMRGALPASGVPVVSWLLAPIVSSLVAASVLQLLVAEDVARNRGDLGLSLLGLATATLVWAAAALRGGARRNGMGTRRGSLGSVLALLFALAAGLATVVVPEASAAESAVACLAGLAALMLVLVVSPLRPRLIRRQLSFGDAQLGAVLAVLAAVLIVSYVLAELGHTAPAAASASTTSRSSASAVTTG